MLARPRWSLWTASLGPLVVLTVASWIGTVNAPALGGSHPLVLMALSPRLPFLAAAAGAVSLPAFFAVGLLRLVAADPSHYLIGRHGYRGVSGRVARRSSSAHRLLERLRRAVGSRGLLVVALRPNGQVLCGAGAAGLRPLPVAAADVAGTLCHLTVAWVAGRSLPGHLLDPSVVVTRAVVLVGAGAVACAGSHRLLRARSARRTAAARRAHPSASRLRRACPSFPGALPDEGWAR